MKLKLTEATLPNFSIEDLESINEIIKRSAKAKEIFPSNVKEWIAFKKQIEFVYSFYNLLTKDKTPQDLRQIANYKTKYQGSLDLEKITLGETNTDFKKSIFEVDGDIGYVSQALRDKIEEKLEQIFKWNSFIKTVNLSSFKQHKKPEEWEEEEEFKEEVEIKELTNNIIELANENNIKLSDNVIWEYKGEKKLNQKIKYLGLTKNIGKLNLKAHIIFGPEIEQSYSRNHPRNEMVFLKYFADIKNLVNYCDRLILSNHNFMNEVYAQLTDVNWKKFSSFSKHLKSISPKIEVYQVTTTWTDERFIELYKKIAGNQTITESKKEKIERVLTEAINGKKILNEVTKPILNIEELEGLTPSAKVKEVIPNNIKEWLLFQKQVNRQYDLYFQFRKDLKEKTGEEILNDFGITEYSSYYHTDYYHTEIYDKIFKAKRI